LLSNHESKINSLYHVIQLLAERRYQLFAGNYTRYSHVPIDFGPNILRLICNKL